jgi:hypothetical protein
LNRFYTTSGERRPKHRAELGVAIVQRVSPLLQESSGLAGRVARHLLHPSLVGMPGDSGHADTPTLQVNEEQDVICHQPRQVSTSTVKKSVPANTAICD